MRWEARCGGLLTGLGLAVLGGLTGGSSRAEPAPSSTEAFLACVRHRESTNNYAAVNPHGYYGAYQFDQRTWNHTAAHAGRKDLVGIRPDRASPADQDAMAEALLGWLGRTPWHNACEKGGS